MDSLVGRSFVHFLVFLMSFVRSHLSDVFCQVSRNISVKDKIEMYAIRCEINELPSNCGEKTNYEMGCQAQVMNNEHILNCPPLNCDASRMNITEIIYVQPHMSSRICGLVI